MRAKGSSDQRRRSGSASAPDQLSKSCSTSAPASIWARQVIDGALHQQIDQPCEKRRLAIGHALGIDEIAAARSLDHVAGHGPGRAGKADQRRLCRQFCREPPQGLEDRRQAIAKPAADNAPISALLRTGSSKGPWPSAAHRLAQGMGDHQGCR
jgi:hypothetical protein